MKLHENPDEVLYRKVHNDHISYDGEKYNLLIAGFKSKNGLSFTKLGGRKEDDIISFFENKWPDRIKMKAIISITVRECLDMGLYPIDSPSTTNDYHVELYESVDNKNISKINRKLLSEKVKLVKIY